VFIFPSVPDFSFRYFPCICIKTIKKGLMTELLSFVLKSLFFGCFYISSQYSGIKAEIGSIASNPGGLPGIVNFECDYRTLELLVF
jgi:hypothetical protein